MAAQNVCTPPTDRPPRRCRQPSEAAVAALVELVGRSEAGLQAAASILQSGSSGNLRGGGVDARALLARLAHVHTGFQAASLRSQSTKQRARSAALEPARTGQVAPGQPVDSPGLSRGSGGMLSAGRERAKPEWQG